VENKLILSDADGVLLSWEWYFDRWMYKHGFTKTRHNSYAISEAYGLTEYTAAQLIKMFNETIYVGNLPPLRDALKYVRKLHEDFGCVFHVISSISGEAEIAEARQKNLKSIFGDSVFYKITCLEPTVSKLSALVEYADTGAFWIEDVVSNYHIGEQLNLTPILITHGYNATETVANRVYNWQAIYNQVASRIESE
jgi:hypothetical protein